MTEEEEDFVDHFFKSYCDNLLEFVRKLTEAGITTEVLNRDVLPKMTEIYNRSRVAALADFRQTVEARNATKH